MKELTVKNIQVYGLAESIVRAHYSVLTETPDESEFKNTVQEVQSAIDNCDYENKYLKLAFKLANKKGGEDQFLSTVYVNFDVTASIKWFAQAERYKFLMFTTSTSTMKSIMKFDLNESAIFNDRVNPATIDLLSNIRDAALVGEGDVCEKEVIYNTPCGLNLTAGVSCSYRCLANIYSQRCKHRLIEWRDFCDWIETLPLAEELLIDKRKKYGIINTTMKPGEMIISNGKRFIFNGNNFVQYSQTDADKISIQERMAIVNAK